MEEHKFKIVPQDKEFRFKKLCPYCDGDLIYRVNGWEKEDEFWMATDFEHECSNEPEDMESEEWDEWMNQHSDMPYVNQLPVSLRVEAWINERYRFDVKE